MPRKVTVPDFTESEEGTKHYKRFRGLDYSTDETQIDDGRSPRAVNVIADEEAFPSGAMDGARCCGLQMRTARLFLSPVFFPTRTTMTRKT